MLDKIIEINKIDVRKYPKVYDLTVPSTLNFGLANGLCCWYSKKMDMFKETVKSMEDIMIKYDNTVRTSTGSIYQFIYGDNGINSTKQYAYNFELLGMNNKKIKDKYYFDEK